MNMRERIWRSIQQQNLDNGGAPIPNIEAGKIADAVLDALLEPTEGMVKAAGDFADIPEWIFTTMIAAATEGK